MKFVIRKSYSVMGRKIKVKIVDTNDWAGLWNPQNDTIYLSCNQSDDELMETFFHELNHCMQWLSGVNQAVSRELLEVMAEMNSRMLATVIRDS